MNASRELLSPRRKRSAPQGWHALARRLKELRLEAAYHVLDALQATLRLALWRNQQREGRLARTRLNQGGRALMLAQGLASSREERKTLKDRH